MPARLTVHFPSRPARVLLLSEDRETVVGREPDCDVVLDDDRVSRRHARLAFDGSGWSVADLASKNIPLEGDIRRGPFGALAFFRDPEGNRLALLQAQ